MGEVLLYAMAARRFRVVCPAVGIWALQGYLAHEKQRPPRTLQKDSASGPMAVLGGVG